VYRVANRSGLIKPEIDGMGAERIKRTLDSSVKNNLIRTAGFVPEQRNPILQRGGGGAGQRKKTRIYRLQKPSGDRTLRINGIPVAEKPGVPGPKQNKSPVSTGAGISGKAASKKNSALSRVTEAGLNAVRGSASDDFTTRAAGQAASMGLRQAGKLPGQTARGVKGAVYGSYRFGKYSTGLIKGIKDNTITGKAAALDALKRGSKSFYGAGANLRRSINDSAISGIKNIKGSDDLGIQTVVMAKNAAFAIHGASRKVARIAGAGRVSHAAKARKAKKAARKARKAEKAALQLVVRTKTTISNILHKTAKKNALPLFFILFCILLPVYTVMNALPSFTVKSDFKEVQKAYERITELDTDMRGDIMQAGRDDAVKRYFLNGVETSMNSLRVYTDAELLLAYFDVKYEEYTYDGIVFGLGGGTKIKDEIENIHAILHQLDIAEWEETFIEESADGSVYISVKYYCNVYLTTRPLLTFFEENRDTLFTEDEQELLDALLEVGAFTMWQELGSPFPGIDWSGRISSRQGWRIHPITQEKQLHTGVDIGMPRGTEIHACHSGTVTLGENDTAGRWIRVTFENGDYTEYLHLDTQLAAAGQKVLFGEVIGTVGTTGLSTGYHLHLTYYKDGIIANPVFFLANTVP
jgi:hypothetical protein